MHNTGKSFEKAIEQVFNYMYHNYPNATIKHNVFLNGPDGKRQFDVVISITIPDGELVTVIEAKDYNSKLSIQKIDEFHSKMRDVNANKGILISKMGFSSKAISKAKRFGIVLYSLNDYTEFEEFDLKIPVLIEELSLEKIDLRFGIQRQEIEKINYSSGDSTVVFNRKAIVINDNNINKLVNESWENGSLRFQSTNKVQEVDIPNLFAPFYLQYQTKSIIPENRTAEIENIKLLITLRYNYYLSDIREIMYSNMLKNIDKNQLTFFIDSNSVKERLPNLKQITGAQATEFTGVAYLFRIRNNVDISFEGMEYVGTK